MAKYQLRERDEMHAQNCSHGSKGKPYMLTRLSEVYAKG
jgi:hypothetical protein